MLDITAKTQVKKLARQSARETRSRKNNNKQQSSRSFDTYWKGSLSDYVTALAWSVDGDYLAAGAASGEILLWTGTHSVLLRSVASEQAIDTLGFSANGQYLAAAGQQGSVSVSYTHLTLPTIYSV